MSTDRYTKAVLTVIAMALTVIALRPLTSVTPAIAGDDTSKIASSVSKIESRLRDLASDIGRIELGTCANDKIC